VKPFKCPKVGTGPSAAAPAVADADAADAGGICMICNQTTPTLVRRGFNPTGVIWMCETCRFNQ